jgi:hypothetical protein
VLGIRRQYPSKRRVGLIDHDILPNRARDKDLVGVAAEIVSGRRPFIGRHSSGFDRQLKIARAVMHA